MGELFLCRSDWPYLLNHIHHMHPTLYILSSRIYLILSALSSDTNIKIQISNKFTCHRPVYIVAFTDE